MGADTLSQNSFMSDFNKIKYTTDSQEEFKYYFFYIIFKRKWLIISLSIIAIALTVLSTYLYMPLYKATSKIMVRATTSQEVILFRDLYRQDPRITNVVPANNFVEIATSTAVARIIVGKFQLDKKLRTKLEDPEGFREYFWYCIDKIESGTKRAIKFPYNLFQRITTGKYPEKSERDYTAMAVKKFMKDGTDIDVAAESDVITLSIWSELPKDAEAIAKELTTLVIQKSISLEQNAAANGYDFVRSELEKAKNQLAIAEQKVSQFKQKWNISNIKKQKELKLYELDEADRSLVEVTAELSAKRARVKEIMRQLNEQKKALKSLDAYEHLLNESILIKVDINALVAKKEDYQRARALIEAALEGLVDKELDLTRLEREVVLKEQFFSRLGSKHDELNVQRVSDLGGLDLRIIDTPKLSEHAEADWPWWDVNLGIGIPASILLAIVLAFLLELLNESFWIGNQIEKRLNIPLLGTIREFRD